MDVKYILRFVVNDLIFQCWRFNFWFNFLMYAIPNSVESTSKQSSAACQYENYPTRPKTSTVRAQNRLEVAEHKGNKQIGTQAKKRNQ